MIENSESEYVSIPIKNKWDLNPRLNLKKEENSHILRFDSSVVNEFLRRKNEGAILVTGKRGVGKTSLIYSCVNNLVKESRDKKNITCYNKLH